MLHTDIQRKNSLHVLLTSPYKLTDMPQLLEKTDSIFSSRLSASSAAPVRHPDLRDPPGAFSSQHSSVLVVTANFCPARLSPTLLLGPCIFCSFAASLLFHSLFRVDHGLLLLLLIVPPWYLPSTSLLTTTSAASTLGVLSLHPCYLPPLPPFLAPPYPEPLTSTHP